MYDRKDKATSVFKVNIYENSFKKTFTNTINVGGWSANEKGEVLFGIGIDDDDWDRETTLFWARETVESEWKLVKQRKAFQGENFVPLLVKEGKLYVISDHDTGRNALWLFDIKTAEFEKVLWKHDKYDVLRAFYNSDLTEIIGVSYAEHFTHTEFFNEKESKAYRVASNSLKGYHTSIASLSDDRNQVLVLAQKPNLPTKYFWLDLNKNTGGFWYSQYPYLEREELGVTMPVAFNARDGLDINGYLTLPPKTLNKKPKLIVHPHGGPFGPRDYQFFNPYVKYMASLGYAVLQVNFRGSGGYGTAFQVKGYRQWGKKMQEDVYDAVDWLRQQNLVDTSQACIVGGSYGGYVALTAAFQKPDDYKCIVSIAGIPNLYDLAVQDSKFKGGLKAHTRERVGDPDDKVIAKELKFYSASNHIDKIKSPILLIHGDKDSRVRESQSSEFYNKAKRAGKDITYVNFKYGTHFLDEHDNRQAAFKSIGEFLQKHLN